MKKILFDKNPDGSVTFTREDMEIITQEYNDKQSILKMLIGNAYDELINDLKKRITDVAEFAYSDENDAVDFSVGNDFDDASQSSHYFFRVSVALWGEKLNQKLLYEKGEQIGEWTCLEASSHRFEFMLFTTKEVWLQTNSL
jgi:hypothetical protein